MNFREFQTNVYKHRSRGATRKQEKAYNHKKNGDRHFVELKKEQEI